MSHFVELNSGAVSKKPPNCIQLFNSPLKAQEWARGRMESPLWNTDSAG